MQSSLLKIIFTQILHKSAFCQSFFENLINFISFVMLSGRFNREGQLNHGFSARYYLVLENKSVKTVV